MVRPCSARYGFHSSTRDTEMIPSTAYRIMVPPNTHTALNGAITWGGMADSYYEYLIKTYKLLGASEGAKMYRQIYEESVDTAKQLLYTDITVVPERDLFAIGKWESNRLIPEIEHLTCFAGAMLGLGSKLLDRPDDLVDAEKITQSCYWLSAATTTGLQPERVEFFAPGREIYANYTEDGEIYHPPYTGYIAEGGVGEGMNRDRYGELRWNIDGTLVRMAGGDEEEVVHEERLSGNPPGTYKGDMRGINRPETIESVFYM